MSGFKQSQYQQWMMIGLQLSLGLMASSIAWAVTPLDCLQGLFHSLSFQENSALSYRKLEDQHFEREEFSSVRIGIEKLSLEISARRARVPEFRYLREEAQKLGLRVWLFGGTAASYSHYVKWDILRELGDTRFQFNRFDYDYTNIFRTTQDLDIVVDGSAEKALEFESSIKARFPYFFGSKEANWEVRSLRESQEDKGGLLGDFGFMNQHTDSNSTGMVELTDPPSGESVIRDLRDWNNKNEPKFLKDLNEGVLTYYYSSQHSATPRAKSGKNPPIFSVVRALTKAFQYGLKVSDQDLLIMQREVQQFDPKKDLKDNYTAFWIEKNGIKLFQHALDLEYAWNLVEALGLRTRLILIRNNPRELGSLSWWMSKEPLRRKPVGQGSGKTAKSLGIKIVAHETKDFLAYESITRSHSGAPNVFISRLNFAGESAEKGEGFYSLSGKEGGRGTGITIHFQVDPLAREGTDFVLANGGSDQLMGEVAEGTSIIWKNKNAIRVIPESLDFSPVEYFEYLANHQKIPHDARALFWKLRRRIDHELISGRVDQNELEKIRFIAWKSFAENDYQITPVFEEWINAESLRLKKDRKQVDELIESFKVESYRADPAPFVLKILELSQNMGSSKISVVEWIDNFLDKLKLDLGNRALERCLFSQVPELQNFGKRVLSYRQKNGKDSFKRDAFISAVKEIVLKKVDPKDWLMQKLETQTDILNRVAYLVLHPELRRELSLSELQWIEPLMKKSSNIAVFEGLAQGGWPIGIQSESFQFKSFEFPREGKKVLLGSTDDLKHRYGDGQTEVTLTQSFQIQVTPVTQLQWALVMGNNPSNFARSGERIKVNDREIELYPNRPVERVSWDNAQEFIHKLNSIDPEYVYRLPTEAEWEFSARSDADWNSLFSFGSDDLELTGYGWYLRNSMGQTHDVAMLKPNSYGLYDTQGNLSEWVQDWWGMNRFTKLVDPIGPPMGRFRVTRGGSWADPLNALRIAARGTQGQTHLSHYTGFRLVRTPR